MERKQIEEYKVPWDELEVVIKKYLADTYSLEIPDGAQIRVLNEKEVMVKPHKLRIKYESGLVKGGRWRKEEVE